MAATNTTESSGMSEIEALRRQLAERDREKAELLIENAHLRRDIEEVRDQREGTTGILRVMAGGPTDLKGVFRAIAESAMRLCHGTAGVVALTDGEHIWPTVGVGASYERHEGCGAQLTAPKWAVSLRARSVNVPAARAVTTGSTQHAPDLLADEELRDRMANDIAHGVRAVLSTPLRGADRILGAVSVLKVESGPFSNGQITLLQTFADQAVIAIENARLFTELQERDERRQAELERASAIQQRLLPSEVVGWPGVLDVAVRFRPAVETSGDFYDVLRLAPVREDGLPPLQIAVGDVAGKGMSAALVTALARSALQLSATVPSGMATPATTLRIAGQRLHRDVGSSHFVACALAVVEPPGLHHSGPRLKLANAAQVPVLLVRDGTVQELEPPGYRLPLGVQPDGDYKDVEADLRPGDVVVFSSDGLVEAPARTGATAAEHLPPPEQAAALFGFARLQQSAAHWSSGGTTAEAIAEGIWRDLTAWCGEESHHDDMTLLVLRVP